MRMQYRQPFIIMLLLVMSALLFWGCEDKKEASKAPVVSKKIAVKSQPQTSTPGTPKMDASENKADEAIVGGQGPKIASRIYDPKQRINPFTPVFGNKDKNAGEKTRKRKKRTPQTPLEKISLDQLKLVAIIRASSGNRALVEDTIGKGYIIKNGTYIGLNAGMVTQINADSIIVEEEVENLKGDFVLQSTEIKLQKPAGE